MDENEAGGDTAVDAGSFQGNRYIGTCPPHPDSPYSVFTDDIEMMFGDALVKGIAEAKQFFAKLDAPFKTVHDVRAVWQIGNAFVMQGSADMLKKGAAPEM